ncbi:MAG: sensor histidine kinase, partial [Thiohalomonadales bacterium]
TPLAALKIQAQVAKAAKTNDEKLPAINNIIAGVDRATHLVQQMLVLARLSSEDKKNINPINIHKTAEELIAQLALRAIEKNINLSFHCKNNYIIYGETANFEILLANILNNAINYTPNNGSVVVEINDSENNINLNVTDTGIGIKEKDLDRVFERYYRVRDAVADGCGLGLTISKQCAEQLNAMIKFIKPKNGVGLTVNISFPKQYPI